MSGGDYPELLADLAERAAGILRAEGLAPDRAQAVGFQVAEAVRQHWGGQLIYVPVGAHYETGQRDLEMWRDFNGCNHEALVRQYNVTIVHVYRVVKKMRRLQRARDQRDLFAAAAVVSSAPQLPPRSKL